MGLVRVIYYRRTVLRANTVCHRDLLYRQKRLLSQQVLYIHTRTSYEYLASEGHYIWPLMIEKCKHFLITRYLQVSDGHLPNTPLDRAYCIGLGSLMRVGMQHLIDECRLICLERCRHIYMLAGSRRPYHAVSEQRSRCCRVTAVGRPPPRWTVFSQGGTTYHRVESLSRFVWR